MNTRTMQSHRLTHRKDQVRLKEAVVCRNSGCATSARNYHRLGSGYFPIASCGIPPMYVRWQCLVVTTEAHRRCRASLEKAVQDPAAQALRLPGAATLTAADRM